MQETITQLFSYARGMWRYRWVGLVAMWLATLIAWAIVLVLPNKYESTARIQIDTATLLKPLLKGLTADNDTLDQVTMMTRTILSRP
ncbi:MAG: lipopolysaccharide biosynthesis protein, partial [Halothiobacillaceae bacterium]